MIFLLGNMLVLFHVLALVVDHLNSQGTVYTLMVVHKSFVIYLYIYLRFIVELLRVADAMYHGMIQK
jgi:prolipoprotein diacylglyceryltransferase